MLKIVRAESSAKDFIELVSLLNADLSIRDGEDFSFYAQFNKLDNIKHVIVAYHDGIAAGCGAIRVYDDDTIEIKRMFVKPEYRRRGIAAIILAGLESWAKELNFSPCILETGRKQPEAIALYKKSGYQIIPNYGQYESVENSICMKKQIV